jgi:hypothetical protein
MTEGTWQSKAAYLLMAGKQKEREEMFMNKMYP